MLFKKQASTDVWQCAAMTEQRTTSSAESAEGPDIQYQYVVNIRAIETFVNLMAREGLNIPERSSSVSFTLPRRLNMKVLKERGVLYSYSVIRVRRVEDVVEEG
jgi:hypothetical protein